MSLSVQAASHWADGGLLQQAASSAAVGMIFHQSRRQSPAVSMTLVAGLGWGPVDL